MLCFKLPPTSNPVAIFSAWPAVCIVCVVVEKLLQGGFIEKDMYGVVGKTQSLYPLEGPEAQSRIKDPF